MTDDKLTSGAVLTQEVANRFHYARRGSSNNGESIPNENIHGYDDERMRARILLTAEEERRLMRRVDWRLMV